MRRRRDIHCLRRSSFLGTTMVDPELTLSSGHPVAVMDAPTIRKEGWLQKKGERLSTWSKWYFHLLGSDLRYFTDDSMTNEKGACSIQGVQAQKVENGKRAFSFTITHKKSTAGKIIWLGASSEDDRLAWVNTINSATVLASRRRTLAVKSMADRLGLAMKGDLSDLSVKEITFIS